ncbi:MAG: hypothetical protein J07HR59_01393 [Halorubrum sp. J07HR59]|nr:MAG: hypothetical protein J07HR59_01393 [Halorubrum sp. J07HR59]
MLVVSTRSLASQFQLISGPRAALPAFRYRIGPYIWTRVEPSGDFCTAARWSFKYLRAATPVRANIPCV